MKSILAVLITIVCLFAKAEFLTPVALNDKSADARGLQAVQKIESLLANVDLNSNRKCKIQLFRKDYFPGTTSVSLLLGEYERTMYSIPLIEGKRQELKSVIIGQDEMVDIVVCAGFKLVLTACQTTSVVSVNSETQFQSENYDQIYLQLLHVCLIHHYIWNVYVASYDKHL